MTQTEAAKQDYEKSKEDIKTVYCQGEHKESNASRNEDCNCSLRTKENEANE